MAMEMSRFQIEEIVGQDKHRVVFRAHDGESGHTVALRRFLPFGQDGGGLEKEEAIAYGIAAKRVAGMSHVALRAVIHGAVDPIDDIPYLVTEWVDGMPLGDVLAGEPLDPALIIDVLRIALEVSIVLSHVLGEEAVWVETDLQSIIVGTRESGRGFTFWISPFKWLGAQFESRKLSSIVELGEELSGWKRKIVSDTAGHGLGGWLKWLRNNPDTRLAEALEMLAASTGNEPPPPESVLIERATNPLNSLTRKASLAKPLALAAVVSLLVTGSTIYTLHKKAKPPVIAAEYSEQKISPVIHEPEKQEKPEKTEPTPAARELTPAERASARAEELKKEMERANVGKAKTQTPAADAPRKTAKPVVAGKIFTPADRKLWDDLKMGGSVKLRGTPRSLDRSSTGKSIYLFFSNPPNPQELVVVSHQGDFKDAFRPESFIPFLGKEIEITGTCFKEPRGRMGVKIKSIDQIEPAK